MSAPRAFATGLTRLSAAAARRLPSCRSHITASAATSTSTSWRQCRVSPVFQSLRTSSVRSFSTTLPARHGHVHKPKEGEEYESADPGGRITLRFWERVLLTSILLQAVGNVYRQGRRGAQAGCLRRRQPARHCAGPRPRDGGRLRRLMRLLDLPRHCHRRGALRPDARARRRRKRHAGPRLWTHRDEPPGLPGRNDQGARRAGGQAADHDEESAG